MNLEIRKGTMKDAEEIGQLYDTACDALESSINYPGWKKGLYPVMKDAIQGIMEDCLYVALLEDQIVGSFILRHTPEEAYHQARWKKDLSYDRVLVLYTFVVHPDYRHQKIGSSILEAIEQIAKASGMESIRLDVFEENAPAICLYEKSGFEYIQTVDLGLGEYGLEWFKLYEKLVL